MIKTILLCLAAAPILLAMWAVAFAMIRTAWNLRDDPKDNARRVKEFCARRKWENACRGCPFENADGDCSLYVRLPNEWKL